MARQPSFTRKELNIAAGSVKRKILSEINKGTNTNISKTELLTHISKILNLSSSRQLWKGDKFTYLSKWYDNLISEINEINDNKNDLNEEELQTLNQLKIELKRKNKLITALQDSIKVLRTENEELRLYKIKHFGKID